MNIKITSVLLVLFMSIYWISINAQTDSLRIHALQLIDKIEPQVIEWRHHIHENPELGNREFKTAELISNHLKSLGIEVQTGVAHTGVVGILVGGNPGPVIALRADMDALPVTERTSVPFASKVITTYDGSETGVMHACGHDAHVAILMGVANILSSIKSEINGTIKFIFQPAEEGAPQGEQGGADLMVKEGVLTNPDVDVIFGLHMDSKTPIGQISYRAGGIMASVSDFKITVKGKPSHGASPWESVDPIVVSAQIVNSLQTIVSRNVDITKNPAVVTIGSIHGGNRSNIISEQVEMVGTVRALTKTDEVLIYERIRQIATNTAKAYGAEATVQLPLTVYVPSTYNNDSLCELMLPSLRATVGDEKLKQINPITGAEDFSFFSREVPGLYFFVGGMPEDMKPEDAADHHTADFYLDDSAFKTGVRAFVNLVLDYKKMSSE